MLSFTSAHQIMKLMLIALVVGIGIGLKECSGYEFRVGDLNCWGVPPSSNPNLYGIWSQYNQLHLGDSLLFLYPPSQDSVIQVSERAFAACHTGRPIVKLADGNSVFNLTAPGKYYFTSASAEHCQKHQKLAIAVPYSNGSYAFPPSADDQYDMFDSPAGAPSYPLASGPSGSASTPPSRAANAVVVGASFVTGMAVAFALSVLL